MIVGKGEEGEAADSYRNIKGNWSYLCEDLSPYFSRR